MKKEDFRFFEPLRVRWAEVDLQKIVFNAHYLMYVDTAMAGYWRAVALPYSDTMADLGGDLFVRKSSVEYHASAEYDDRLQVGMRCARMGNSSMGFEAAVFRGDEVLVTAELIYVYADPHVHKSVPIPESLRQVLNAYEAGDSMIEIRKEPWSSCQEEVRALRRSVFVGEWHMPDAWITEPLDEQAHHLVARNRLGRVVGACRLHALPEGVGQVSRLAVHRGTRGSRIGSALLQTILSDSPFSHLKRLNLDTRLSTVPFFESLGFQPEGPSVESQGIMHQRLVLNR